MPVPQTHPPHSFLFLLGEWRNTGEIRWGRCEVLVLASEGKWSEVKSLSRVWLFVTPLTVAYQAPLSMGFSRQEYWNGLPFLSRGDLPDSGIEPRSSALQADALTSEPPGKCAEYSKRVTMNARPNTSAVREWKTPGSLEQAQRKLLRSMGAGCASQ